MVRLKALPLFHKVGLTAISIPYGSIKSKPANILPQSHIQISIPYGSIKRIGGNRLGSGNKNFNSLWFD